MQDAMDLNFHLSDYDHENERHAEIYVDPQTLTVTVDRSVETNDDYLSSGDDIPEDWSDNHEFKFESGSSLLAFVTALIDELLDCCFAYFDEEGDEIDDSDDARQLIMEMLNAVDVGKTIDGSGRIHGDDLEEIIETLVDYPR